MTNVTAGNSWYESLAALFDKPSSFFEENEVQVCADKSTQRYRVRSRKIGVPVPWPDQSTNELLGKALGEHGFITSADHPVYSELTEGEEL